MTPRRFPPHGRPRYSRTTTSCATLTDSNSLTSITRMNRGGALPPSYSRRTRHEGLRRTLRNCPSYWRDLSRNHPSAAPVRIFSIPYCLAPFLKLRRARGRSFQERTGQQRQSRLGQDALEGSLSRERFLHATLRCLPRCDFGNPRRRAADGANDPPPLPNRMPMKSRADIRRFNGVRIVRAHHPADQRQPKQG